MFQYHFLINTFLSTYLVAFVISDFKNLTDGNFSVWARPSALESARYALEVGPKILRFFESYFNISYPLPKLDMIALPDFGAGAMENWGLVTFREVAMLYDPVISAPLNKQRVATIIAHELAHQWFGNLVTPVWWSDLWLNEGFASYMEFVGANFTNPQWKTMDQFVCNELQNVFNLDSLASSHKISVEVHDPDSINEIFDKISYGKGAAIIRMMEHFLTTDVFKAGLNSYLTIKAYDVATQDDLWLQLTKHAQMSNTFDNLTNVKQIMDTWTTQMGFPVITVNRNYSTKMVNFTQNRFTFVPSNQWKKLNMAFKESVWWVPISYTTSNELDFNDTKPDEWIRGIDHIEKSITNLTDKDWILVNIQSTSYYRVNYDERNWNLLDSWLQDPTLHTKIVPTNRAQIIDDSLALARAGKLDYRIALNLTRYLKHEHEYVPWRSALGSVNFIDKMMSSGPKYDLFKKYFIDLIENIYQRTSSFENKSDDDPLTAYLRVEVMTFACRLGHSDCITESVALFERWMNATDPDKENLIPSNIRSIVYCTAIKHGDEREWDFMWNRYMNAIVSSEKELLLDAMSCTREHWILNRYLERSLTENSGIRKQDLVRVFITISNNAIGLPITFNFIRSNWERLKEYLGPPMMNLYVLLSYTFQNANTKHDLDMFERFVNENIEGKSRTISQVIENLKVNINWMEENSQTIVQWLGNVTQT